MPARHGPPTHTQRAPPTPTPESIASIKTHLSCSGGGGDRNRKAPVLPIRALTTTTAASSVHAPVLLLRCILPLPRPPQVCACLERVMRAIGRFKEWLTPASQHRRFPFPVSLFVCVIDRIGRGSASIQCTARQNQQNNPTHAKPRATARRRRLASLHWMVQVSSPRRVSIGGPSRSLGVRRAAAAISINRMRACVPHRIPPRSILGLQSGGRGRGSRWTRRLRLSQHRPSSATAAGDGRTATHGSSKEASYKQPTARCRRAHHHHLQPLLDLLVRVDSLLGWI